MDPECAGDFGGDLFAYEDSRSHIQGLLFIRLWGYDSQAVWKGCQVAQRLVVGDSKDHNLCFDHWRANGLYSLATHTSIPE